MEILHPASYCQESCKGSKSEQSLAHQESTFHFEWAEARKHLTLVVESSNLHTTATSRSTTQFAEKKCWPKRDLAISSTDRLITAAVRRYLQPIERIKNRPMLYSGDRRPETTPKIWIQNLKVYALIFVKFFFFFSNIYIGLNKVNVNWNIKHKNIKHLFHCRNF